MQQNLTCKHSTRWEVKNFKLQNNDHPTVCIIGRYIMYMNLPIYLKKIFISFKLTLIYLTEEDRLVEYEVNREELEHPTLI